MTQTAFIINPYAGKGSVGKKWSSIESFARSQLGQFKTYITTGPGDATRFVIEAVQDGAGLLVCVGGDGTLNEIVNGFMTHEASLRSDLTIGVVPTGT